MNIGAEGGGKEGGLKMTTTDYQEINLYTTSPIPASGIEHFL